MNERTPGLAKAASFFLTLLAILFTVGSVSAETPATVRVMSAPLAFEPNVGQADAEAQYIARGSGYRVVLDRDDARILMIGKRDTSNPTSAVVRMKLLGASPAPQLSALDQLEGRTNYLIGDKSQWRTDVPNFAKVRYSGVYQGIDVVYYGTHGLLEYDFNIQPNADASKIRFSLEGADSVELEDGNLMIQTSAGVATLHKPLAYQEVNGERQMVESAYVIDADHNVRFSLGRYDHTRTLVIDPSISVFGIGDNNAGSQDGAMAAAVDPTTGEVYIAGYVYGNSLANSGNGLLASIYLLKFANASSMSPAYTTVIGGNANDYAFSVAIEPACTGASAGSGSCAIIGGLINSPSGAATGDLTLGSIDAGQTLGGDDGVVLKVNAGGNGLVYTRRVGGIENDRVDSIAVAPNGMVYAVGATQSTVASWGTSYSCTPSASCWVPFAVDLNITTGAIAGGTYLGSGSYPAPQLVSPPSIVLYGGSIPNRLMKVAANSANHVYVVGSAMLSSGVPQAFVTQLSGLAVNYTVYFGDDSTTADIGGPDNGVAGNGIAATSQDVVYVVGSVFGTLKNICSSCLVGSGPVAPGVYSSVYILQLNGSSNGAVTAYTYLTSTESNHGGDVALDSANNVVVVGDAADASAQTNPVNAQGNPIPQVLFPTMNAAQGSSAGGIDGFITKLTPSLTMVYSTFAGTTGTDYLRAVAVSPGFTYAAGYTYQGAGLFRSFVPVLNENATSLNGPVSVSACTSLQNPCVVTAADQVVATATVSLTGAGVPSLAETDGSGFVTFGPATPGSSPNTYTFTIIVTPQAFASLNPTVTLRPIIQASFGTNQSTPVTLNLTGGYVLAVSPNPVQSGNNVTISVPVPSGFGGGSVALSASSTTNLILNSPNQTIPSAAGTVTFTAAATGNLSSNVTVHLQATLTSGSQSTTIGSSPDLVITPASSSNLSVQSLVLSYSTSSGTSLTVPGGVTVTGAVTICSGAAPTGSTIVYLSGFGGAATVPATPLTITRSCIATFSVTAPAVAANSTTTIVASAVQGANQASATLTITAPTVMALKLNTTASSLAPNTSVTGTITVSGALPSGAAPVLTSSAPALLTITAGPTLSGTNTYSFTIMTADQPVSGDVGLTATLFGSQQTVFLTVTAPTTTGVSGLYVTSTACNAVNMSGNASTDSYNSLSGPYSQSKQTSGGDVHVAGNANLTGNATVDGVIYTGLTPAVGNCKNGTGDGISLSGKAKATGNPPYQALTPVTFNAPVISFPAGSKPADLNVNSNTTASSFVYNNINVSGKAVLTLPAGVYTINSINLSGQAELVVLGPVTLNIVGNSSGPGPASTPLNFSGGSVGDASANPAAANLLVNYGGTGTINLSGQADSYGVIFAPNAAANVSGQSGWFGAMVVNTLTLTGQAAIHLDQALGH